MSTAADICIYGGAAGGGKTFGLLMQPLRYMNVRGFGCTIFRKNFNQIFSQGGLWDEAAKMYSQIPGAHPRMSSYSWLFDDKNGNAISKVTFAHIERDQELDRWQGTQICAIEFDELTHFSEKAFFYMLSRKWQGRLDQCIQKDDYNFEMEADELQKALDVAKKENDIQQYIKRTGKWFIPASILRDYDFGHHSAYLGQYRTEKRKRSQIVI